MSNLPPPSAGGPPPPPPPPTAPPPPAGTYHVTRRAPDGIGGVYYSVGLTILLTIVTLGFWRFLWSYRTSEDLKRYNGEGVGGVLSIVINFLLAIILMFTIPDEIRRMYERAGRNSPVSAVWGLWFLLPIIGNIVWYVKVQRALNEFWLSVGSRPA